MIMRESDMAVSLTEAQRIAERPGVFVTTDLFDVPTDTSAASAAIMASHRHAPTLDAEMNMAVAYYWWAMTLAATGPNIIIASRRPAPLTVAQLAEVMRQIVLSPHYVGQGIDAVTMAGAPVTLRRGVITHGTAPAPQRGGWNG